MLPAADPELRVALMEALGCLFMNLVMFSIVCLCMEGVLGFFLLFTVKLVTGSEGET